jgi:chaperonin cofactor prefoldin
MRFTVEEFHDLIKLLEEKPEWREELRRLVLTDELLKLPEVFQELVEVQRRTEERIGALTERLETLERRVEELTERLETLERKVEELAEAQRRTEERLESLIERIETLTAHMDTLATAHRRLEDKLGRMRGQMLELLYVKRAGAFFGRFLRRVQVVETHTLEDRLESQLSPGEFNDLLLLNLLVKGRLRHAEDKEIWLAVEISATVDRTDVERTARRARLLRKAGYQAIPVAAGEETTLGAEEAARLEKVALMRDGVISLWEEALEAWMN